MIARIIPKTPTNRTTSTQLQADSQQPNKELGTSKQPKTIDWLSNQSQATYPRTVRLQQSEQLI